MITALTAKTRHPRSTTFHKTLEIDLASEYKVREIEGLGPVKAEISTVANASEAGSQFLTSRDNDRNIVLTVGFEPDYTSGQTVTSLRRSLMDVFMPQYHVLLEFETEDMDVMTIEGVVETHTPTIFSEAPTVQISIICSYPYFKRKGESAVVYTLPAGNLLDTLVPYDGNVPVGFLFETTLTQDWNGSVGIGTNELGEYLQLTRSDFRAGDTIRFSTVAGDRYVHRQRAGDWQKVNMLGYFRGSLTAVKLYPGNNPFEIYPQILTNTKFIYNKVYGGL